MGAGGRTCGRCGAAAKDDGRFCAYCGAELPAPAVPPGPLDGIDARLAALESHPDLPDLLAHTPSSGAFTCGTFVGVVFGLVFAGIALFIAGRFDMAGAGMLSAIPYVFVVVGVLIALFSIVKAARFAQAPLQRTPACVVDERTQVSGGGNNSSASTAYFATLEFKGGRRQEYLVLHRLAGQVAAGDVGMAYVKGDVLLDFRRLRG